MTNSVAIPYLEQVMKYSDTLLGLPAIPLLLIGCLAVGYLFKAIPVYPNKWIPLGVYGVGIVGSFALTPLKSGVEIGRALIYGIVVAAFAIFIHRKWLSKYDKDMEPQDTAQISKPTTTGTTQP